MTIAVAGRRIPAFLFLALACNLFSATGCDRRTVFLGAPVLTVDAGNRVVEALGIEGDRIGAVGSEDEVRAWAGPRARIVELAGGAIVPGFIDAHGHFPGEGIWARVVDLNPPPIGDLDSIDELVARLRARAEETPAGEWVAGMGYDDTLLAEGRHPTRVDLDRVSTEHPVAILHISGHLASINSRALAELGWDANTPDPEGGAIRRDPETGEPDGVLEENAAEFVQARLMDPGLLDGLAILRLASRRALAHGVTTTQSGYTPARQMRVMPWLSRLGLLPLRIVLWPSMEAVDEVLDGGRPFSTVDPGWVRVGAVKLIADGSIQGYTGYLSEPYFVPPGDDPEFRGNPRLARDELIRRVRRYHAAGWQIAVHGNGDAAIDDILDAFEIALREHPRKDPRFILIHAQMARDDQLDRMRQLGVTPSFFSLHTYYWGDRHRDRFMGPERAARMSPARSALDKGVRFTIHCDAPVVPMEPLRLIWSAVNRISSSGRIIGPDERITPMQALRATTIDAAWQIREEDNRGSLEPGKWADFVILSASPLDDPEHIDRIRVLETHIAGKRVHRASDVGGGG
ncbi:MAG TPA: amidohydrolase [Deltaproteobacteria bacterium]|nr:amidohydrolase [Deltaproteobacteria bacterium]